MKCSNIPSYVYAAKTGLSFKCAALLYNKTNGCCYQNINNSVEIGSSVGISKLRAIFNTQIHFCTNKLRSFWVSVIFSVKLSLFFLFLLGRIQDLCIIFAIIVVFLVFFNTYIFQAGLVSLLIRKFKTTIIISILYLALSVGLHVWTMVSILWFYSIKTYASCNAIYIL